jgi:ketosteroid isomerase-like protein
MSDLQNWIDRLEIRDVLERYMRSNDDGDADALAELFTADATFQIFGTVYSGREAIRAVFAGAFVSPPRPWTVEGNLFVQPRSLHIGTNPVIDVDGDRATAEIDFQVVGRDVDGRGVFHLLGRYRDRLRRDDDGRWRIECRTAVSVARPGEEGTDPEWQQMIARMPDEMKTRLRRT